MHAIPHPLTAVWNELYILCSLLLAIAIGASILPRILYVSHKKKLFDIPNERSVHDKPIPRLGGLSFFPTIIIVCGLSIGVRYLLGLSISTSIAPLDMLCKYLMLVVGMTILYLIGIADDLTGVSYKPKFLAQLVAATLIAISGTWLNTLNGFLGINELPAWLGMPITIFLVIYITNAINLIDGVDGLASGLCIIALVALTVINLYHRQYYLALLGVATMGVLIPFWLYNVFGNAKRGHKIFMGDTGSLTLGLILSFIVINMSRNETGIQGDTNHTMAIAFATLLVPLFDVVRVVCRRLSSGKNPFLPDKNHFHHKLLRTGLRSRGVMVTILCFSSFFIFLNTALTLSLNITWILLIDIVVWVAFHAYITFLGNKRRRANEAEQHNMEGNNTNQCRA